LVLERKTILVPSGTFSLISYRTLRRSFSNERRNLFFNYCNLIVVDRKGFITIRLARGVKEERIYVSRPSRPIWTNSPGTWDFDYRTSLG
jgi:hypothetical protein